MALTGFTRRFYVRFWNMNRGRAGPSLMGVGVLVPKLFVLASLLVGVVLGLLRLLADIKDWLVFCLSAVYLWALVQRSLRCG